MWLVQVDLVSLNLVIQKLKGEENLTARLRNVFRRRKGEGENNEN